MPMVSSDTWGYGYQVERDIKGSHSLKRSFKWIRADDVHGMYLCQGVGYDDISQAADLS